MLVLSRKKDECIVINNDITIVVVEIRGDKVRLGIEAPKEVPVHRREVFEAIARGTDESGHPEVGHPPSGHPMTILEGSRMPLDRSADHSADTATAVPAGVKERAPDGSPVPSSSMPDPLVAEEAAAGHALTLPGIAGRDRPSGS